jgi:hypothetical protein
MTSTDDIKRVRSFDGINRVGSFDGPKALAWQDKVVKFFDGGIGMAVMTVGTFFALFGDDIRLAFLPKSVDPTFAALTFVVLLLFVIEFVAFNVSKKHFLWGFFFWLDLVAVMSLLPDIDFLWNPIFVGYGGDLDDGQAETGGAVARAGRASRAGTKAGRAIRIIRIIRLVRVVKLYKYCCAKSKGRSDEGVMEAASEEASFSDELSGSKIGSSLQEFIMRRVILGVLLMLIIFPSLRTFEEENSNQMHLQMLEETYGSFPAYFDNSVTSYIDNQPDMMYFSQDGQLPFVNKASELALLRVVEIERVVSANFTFDAILDRKDISILKAQLNIILTIFIIILLGGGAWQFSKDAHSMVIIPIERMVDFVERLAANPLGKIKPRGGDADNGGLEIKVLESTLMKLVGLLQVGFGDAGAGIIAKNLGNTGLNPIVPGKKIYAIYGFCDIRKFNDCTEKLQEQTMIFVNQIAEIVHERCNTFGGDANKNTGNAFLMLWKVSFTL